MGSAKLLGRVSAIPLRLLCRDAVGDVALPLQALLQHLKKSIATSFLPFCPTPGIPLPALLPSFQGRERIRPAAANPQGACAGNRDPASGATGVGWRQGVMAAGSTAHTFTPGSSHRRATHGHSVLQPKVKLPTLLLLNLRYSPSCTASKLCAPLDNLSVLTHRFSPLVCFLRRLQLFKTNGPCCKTMAEYHTQQLEAASSATRQRDSKVGTYGLQQISQSVKEGAGFPLA